MSTEADGFAEPDGDVRGLLGEALAGIIDEAYPPGSDERRHLDAAVEDAGKLLAEHECGRLLEDPAGEDRP